MLILWVEAIILLWRCNSPRWLHLLTVGFTHITAGRGASTAFGIGHLDIHPLLVGMVVLYLDVMAMLIMYSALIFSYKYFVEHRFFKEHMQPVFASAQRELTRLRKFKIVGVFIFVWFPLSLTGIVVGSVLGFLLGLRTWVTMTTVILGSASAIICWVYAYELLFGWLEGIGELLPIIVTALLILILVVIRIIAHRKSSTQDARV